MVEKLDEKRHFERQIYASHSLEEKLLWVGLWSFAVFYSIYCVSPASEKNYDFLGTFVMTNGWLPGRLRDNTDTEWSVLAGIHLKSLPWLFIHVIASQVIKKFAKERLIYFWVCFSSLFLICQFGFSGFLFVTIQPVFFFGIHLLGYSHLVWGLSLTFLLGWAHGPYASLRSTLAGPDNTIENYLMAVFCCWVNSRCVSFCLDHIWNEVPDHKSYVDKFLHLLAFCFYLPGCIGGPLINYNEFIKGVRSDYQPWTLPRTLTFIGLLIRYMMWHLVAEVAIHYLYFNALQMNASLLDSLDLWTLAGTGYSMGQFFHLKYVIFYGYPRPFFIADGMEARDHPKCISRIHLYSDMWRYFDTGLYKFMQKYVYGPSQIFVNRTLSKLFASTVSFTYVYIWHGTYGNILIWSVLNYLGIAVETVGRVIGKNESYAKLEESFLSPQGVRRLHCTLTAPLYLMSILSNFYFFMGTEVGHYFVRRAFLSWPLGTPTILFFMYCAAQTSIEAKNFDLKARVVACPILKKKSAWN